MIIKTLEELEPYRHLTVRDDVKPKSGVKAARAYSDLLETEELVRMIYGVNLLYYIVREHQINHKSIIELSNNLGFGNKYLMELMDIKGIPRRTKQEAIKNNVEFHIGVCGLSDEERIKYCSAGGKVSGVVNGRKAVNLKSGIHDPQKRNNYLPTIHGRRIDVPYDAKSAYEANIYRLLAYLGFQVEHDVPVELRVDERAEMFESFNTIFRVDFRAVSPTGSEYYYELCVHPFEGPDGLEKILRFHEQHPERKMIVVTGSQFDSSTFPVSTIRYRALENAFAAAINQSDRFAGWEKKGYNLKTHPEVFAPVLTK